MIPFKKNDAVEAKVSAVPEAALSVIDTAQDEFFEGAPTCAAFLLSLYDAGRLSFSDRIGREYFLSFFRELVANAEELGSFEVILFVLRAVFGEDTEIFFEVPAPGKLEIDIASYDDMLFSVVGVDEDGETALISEEGDEIIGSQVLGIETEAELRNLLAEIVIGGVYFTPSINFFTRYFLVADEGGDPIDVVDDEGNQIIGTEIGG